MCVIDKRKFGCSHDLDERIRCELRLFVRENIGYFQSFENVTVFYGKGQKKISRALCVGFAASISALSSP